MCAAVQAQRTQARWAGATGDLGDVPAFPKAHQEQHLPEGTAAQGPPGCRQLLITEPCWGPPC